jgi:hypothetical protein
VTPVSSVYICLPEEDIMTRKILVAALLLLAASAFAEQLDVNTILAKQKAGASAEALVAAVNDPANTLAIKAEEIPALRSGGVPETVIAAIQQKIAPAPTAQPDDARLADVVKIVKSGISESLIAEQIRQSGLTYKLSMNDLLYLKQNGVQDSVISALLATKEKVTALPVEMVFNELLLVRGFGPLRRDRPGRLVLKGDTFSWIDGSDPKENFDFQVPGLQKVWYTCQAQTSGDVCYQINFQIVKGPRYSFADVSRATGSNATVKSIMETLRTNFPRAPFGAPDH